MSSDRYPPQGFTINPGVVAKIKKAVSRPSAVIFNAEDENHETLFLNGQESVSATPTKSPLQNVKMTITQKGLWFFFSFFLVVYIPALYSPAH